MGLNTAIMFGLFLTLVACAPVGVKNPIRVPQKRYVACCDPGINADDKDMCKWMYENHTNRLRDAWGNTVEGIWHDCEPGKEPWRKWE